MEIFFDSWLPMLTWSDTALFEAVSNWECSIWTAIFNIPMCSCLHHYPSSQLRHHQVYPALMVRPQYHSSSRMSSSRTSTSHFKNPSNPPIIYIQDFLTNKQNSQILHKPYRPFSLLDLVSLCFCPTQEDQTRKSPRTRAWHVADLLVFL